MREHDTNKQPYVWTGNEADRPRLGISGFVDIMRGTTVYIVNEDETESEPVLVLKNRHEAPIFVSRADLMVTWDEDEREFGRFTIEVPVTRDQILSIAINALEGGSYGTGSWSQVIHGAGRLTDDHHYQRDATFSLVPYNLGHRTWKAAGFPRLATPAWITPDMLMEGLRLFCIERDRGVDSIIENLDAAEADCIVQLALFGEVTFG